jgi:ABC-2 type transport system ATP-binding protein
VLRFDNLHKSFGAVRALDGCSFEVKRGEMLGFLGPNGSGKTTAMRSVFGLVRPESGDVTWDGSPIGMEQRLRFGYMPEQRGLYPKMKAVDHLAYLCRLHGMSQEDATLSADRWLERFGLQDRRHDRVESLSHGNQQRVQLAAALVHDPQLLLLDEPFSGLDPMGVDTMSEVLTEEAAAGKAVVFSSHQLDLVEDLCEEVAIINQGKIVVEGNVRRLKDASPIRHLELDIDGDAEGLIASLPEVGRVQSSDGFHSVTIGADADIRDFLARAQEAGRIRHFAYKPPSLTDLFREAVR